MGSWLAAGAGAGEGLNDLLNRYLVEDRLAETKRQNLAHEGIANRQIDVQAAYRKALQEETQRRNEFGQANTMAAGLAPGAPVSRGTMSRLLLSGVRVPEQFDTT